VRIASLLASLATLAACSLYDAQPERTSPKGEFIGHRADVALYAGEGGSDPTAAAASINDLGASIVRSDAAQPANAPAAAPPPSPSAASPSVPQGRDRPTEVATPATDCEPGQGDCEPAPSPPAPPIR
jgi:hypothetical protein